MLNCIKSLIGLLICINTTISFSKSLEFEHYNHNFGEVIRGEILSWQASFENKGKEDVRIQGVYSGCGCTAVELEKDKIYRPGQKGNILIKFDTTNFIGNVSKQIIVISNERVRSQTNLNVKARIKEEFVISPVLLDFGLVKSDEEAIKKFDIRPVGDFKFEIKDFQYNERLFEISNLRDGQGWNFIVKLRKGAVSGFIKESVFVETNSEVLPRVKVPIRAEIENLINYSPSYLEFGVVNSKKSRTKTIQLSSSRKFTLKPSEVEVLINNQIIKNTSNILFVKSSDEESKKKRIEIKISNSTELSGSVHGRVTLESNLDVHKRVVVDFYAFFK